MKTIETGSFCRCYPFLPSSTGLLSRCPVQMWNGSVVRLVPTAQAACPGAAFRGASALARPYSSTPPHAGLLAELSREMEEDRYSSPLSLFRRPVSHQLVGQIASLLIMKREGTAHSGGRCNAKARLRLRLRRKAEDFQS